MNQLFTSRAAVTCALYLLFARSAGAAEPRHIVLLAPAAHPAAAALARELRTKEFRVDLLPAPPTGCFGDDAKRFAGNADAVVCADEQAHVFLRDRAGTLQHTHTLSFASSDGNVAAVRAAEILAVRLASSPLPAPASRSQPHGDEALAPWDDNAESRPELRNHLPPALIEPPRANEPAPTRQVIVHLRGSSESADSADDEPSDADRAASPTNERGPVRLGAGLGLLVDDNSGSAIPSLRAAIDIMPLSWAGLHFGGAKFLPDHDDVAGAPRHLLEGGMRLEAPLGDVVAASIGAGGALLNRTRVTPATAAEPGKIGGQWALVPYGDAALELRMSSSVSIAFQGRLYSLPAPAQSTPVDLGVMFTIAP